MAVQPFTLLKNVAQGYVIIVWGPMANGDTGAPYNSSGYGVASVEWQGTPGAGFAGQTQCANNPSSPTLWSSVTALAASGQAFLNSSAIAVASAMVRPNVTAGDGTTSMTCRMLLVN